MRRIIGAVLAAMALIAISTAAVVAKGACGPSGAQYRCGAILVILKADTSDTIGDVIERLGGDPATDILQAFTAVRDLLDPDGVADDTGAATVYSVAVPVGHEAAMAAAYAADPAVYASAVDHETIGSITPPNSATAGQTTSWLTSLGALLVVMSAALEILKRAPRRLVATLAITFLIAALTGCGLARATDNLGTFRAVFLGTPPPNGITSDAAIAAALSTASGRNLTVVSMTAGPWDELKGESAQAHDGRGVTVLYGALAGVR